jgi:hypothetical protein
MAIEGVMKGVPLQASGSMDYEQMMTTIKYLLDASWGSTWGSFTPEGPNVTDPLNVEFPAIVHCLKSMRPGVIGKSGIRELKPRYRYTGLNEDTNGNNPPAATIYGQIFDAEVCFEIWETNGKADFLAKQFRQTLQAFTGYLKEKGLKEMHFELMEDGQTNDSVRDAHKIRKLTYSVRFEELTEVPTDIFRVFDVVDERLQEEAEKQLDKTNDIG